MKLSSICKLIFIVIATHFIVACSEDNNNEANESETAQGDTPSCQTANLSMPLSTTPEFGDGSDGELYLASGEVFFLEARSYNFSNIYTEVDSVLTATDETMEGGGIIQINAAGNCEYYGKFELSSHKGSIELSCDGQVSLSNQTEFLGSPITISGSSSGDSILHFSSTSSEEFNSDTASSTVISSSNVDSGLTFVPNTIEPATIFFIGDEFNTDGFSIVSNGSNVIEGSVLHLDDAILTPKPIENCFIPQK